MNLSIDLNYYIKQIKSDNEKELLMYYYDHLTKHIKDSKDFIKCKKDFLNILLLYKDHNPIIPIELLINGVNNSITQIEQNVINYKELFKKILFILINQK